MKSGGNPALNFGSKTVTPPCPAQFSFPRRRRRRAPFKNRMQNKKGTPGSLAMRASRHRHPTRIMETPDASPFPCAGRVPHAGLRQCFPASFNRIGRKRGTPELSQLQPPNVKRILARFLASLRDQRPRLSRHAVEHGKPRRSERQEPCRQCVGVRRQGRHDRG